MIDYEPFVPTPMGIVHEKLLLAGLESGGLLFDPGCGEGRC